MDLVVAAVAAAAVEKTAITAMKTMRQVDQEVPAAVVAVAMVPVDAVVDHRMESSHIMMEEVDLSLE